MNADDADPIYVSAFIRGGHPLFCILRDWWRAMFVPTSSLCEKWILRLESVATEPRGVPEFHS